jgi:hypothetical protein
MDGKHERELQTIANSTYPGVSRKEMKQLLLNILGHLGQMGQNTTWLQPLVDDMTHTEVALTYQRSGYMARAKYRDPELLDFCFFCMEIYEDLVNLEHLVDDQANPRKLIDRLTDVELKKQILPVPTRPWTTVSGSLAKWRNINDNTIRYLNTLRPEILRKYMQQNNLFASDLNHCLFFKGNVVDSGGNFRVNVLTLPQKLARERAFLQSPVLNKLQCLHFGLYKRRNVANRVSHLPVFGGDANMFAGPALPYGHYLNAIAERDQMYAGSDPFQFIRRMDLDPVLGNDLGMRTREAAVLAMKVVEKYDTTFLASLIKCVDEASISNPGILASVYTRAQEFRQQHRLRNFKPPSRDVLSQGKALLFGLAKKLFNRGSSSVPFKEIFVPTMRGEEKDGKQANKCDVSDGLLAIRLLVQGGIEDILDADTREKIANAIAAPGIDDDNKKFKVIDAILSENDAKAEEAPKQENDKNDGGGANEQCLEEKSYLYRVRHCCW